MSRFPRSGAPLLVLLVLVAGVGLRLDGIREPPVEFHPIRQLNGALLARSMFVAGDADVTDEVRRVAEANRPPILEPPVVEAVTVVGSHVVGRETLLPGRLLGVIAWMIGALALFGLGVRLLSPGAGLVAAALFALLPFGVVASRSFQPDPLAIGLLCVALYLQVRFAGDPEPRRFVAAAVVAAAAVLVKVSVAPVVLAGWVALQLDGAPRGDRTRALLSRRSLTFMAIALGPGAVWTLVQFSNSAADYFILRYLGEGDFWSGLGRQLRRVYGLPVLGLALAGVVVARGAVRWFLIGQAIGFAAFVVMTNYRAATHDYYALAGYPLVALAVAAVFDALRRHLTRHIVVRRVALGAAAVGGAVMVATASLPRDPGLPFAAAEIRHARELGPQLDHSTEVVMLAAGYGEILKYYGNVAGEAWPNEADLALARLQGRDPVAAEERLDRMVAAGRRWFVVTNFFELSRQPDLERALARRALRLETAGYRVYVLGPGTGR